MDQKFKEAQEFNSSLHIAFSSTLENLKILDLPLEQIETKLPSIVALKGINVLLYFI